MISETKTDENFPDTPFCIDGYPSPYRLGGIFLYIREDIPSKMIQTNLQDNFEGFFTEINLGKKMTSWLLL